jgi:hypothetical protein
LTGYLSHRLAAKEVEIIAIEQEAERIAIEEEAGRNRH